MNISTDAWIPIVWTDGKSGLVSLSDVFARGHEIRDLAVHPHERIALMRLLICIAQTSLDGPTDHADWKECRRRIKDSAQSYLNNLKHLFELFDDSRPFLQVANLVPANAEDGNKKGDISKLDLALATGNNTTLFDNSGGIDRIFPPERLALMLLTFQCFSPGGTIGVAFWTGQPTLGWSSHPIIKAGKSEHAPCLPSSMLHAFLRGADLLTSIHLNLLSKDAVAEFAGHDMWGKSVWESMPTSPIDSDYVKNATTTYLGRLVPLSRAIRLKEGSSEFILANGLEYPSYPECREPTATIIVARKKNNAPERTVLRASLDKAPWRELPALMIKSTNQHSNGGPVALQNITDDQAFDLWVGGLVADKAKPLDTVEAVYHIPAALLTDSMQQAGRIYEQGVKYAEKIEFRLRRAISYYHCSIGDDLDRRETRNRRFELQRKATFQFWTDVERSLHHLFEVVEKPQLLCAGKAWHLTPWGRTILNAVRIAYENACPHETPRKIRAYALGLKELFGPSRSGEVNEKQEDANES